VVARGLYGEDARHCRGLAWHAYNAPAGIVVAAKFKRADRVKTDRLCSRLLKNAETYERLA
jgi:hypothetical protein